MPAQRELEAVSVGGGAEQAAATNRDGVDHPERLRLAFEEVASLRQHGLVWGGDIAARVATLTELGDERIDVVRGDVPKHVGPLDAGGLHRRLVHDRARRV